VEIRKGIIRVADVDNKVADVQIIGSMATVVADVPVVDSSLSHLAVGKDCLVVFFRGDAGLVVCTWGEAD
jgi:phage gp45-like